MRPIDADAADVDKIMCYYSDHCRIEDVQEWLDDQPTIDAAPVRRGEWVDNKCDVYWHNSFVHKHCSECGAEPHKNRDDTGRIVGYILSHFCPNCGADMRGETHGTD